jgi:mannose-6-phosphate isomerase-like protein (cupin superfamily)
VQVIRPSEFTGTKPWQAIDIERIDDATVRLHWTDAPYKWHVNDGPKVFAVLSGEVNMHTRDKDGEKVWHLRARRYISR